MSSIDRFDDHNPITLPTVHWPAGAIQKLWRDLNAERIEPLIDDLEFVIATHVEGLRYDAMQPNGDKELDGKLFQLEQAINEVLECFQNMPHSAYHAIRKINYELANDRKPQIADRDYAGLLKTAERTLLELLPAVSEAHNSKYDKLKSGAPLKAFHELFSRLNIIYTRHNRVPHANERAQRKEQLKFIRFIVKAFPQLKAPKRLDREVPRLPFPAHA